MTTKYHLVILQFSESTKTSEAIKIRTLGGEKISWAAQEAGYNAICISRLGNLNFQEIVDLVSPYITENTVIGISTSLMLGTLYGGKISESLDGFRNAVKELRKDHQNDLILGGASAQEFQKYFDSSTAIENIDGENDIVTFLNNKFNHGISKKPPKIWDIKTDDFYFPENSFVQKEEMLPLELSRGCIFSCKFCSFSRIGKSKGTYEKNIDNIRNHIIDNYNRFGTQYYFLTADTVNDNNDRMTEWCDMVESLPFKIFYAGYFRLDLLNKYKETVERLYKTGLRGANFGVETFHPDAARVIEKPFTGQRAKDFLIELRDNIFENNVAMSTGIIIGLPYEPVESIYETVDWFKTDGKGIEPSFNSLTLVCPERGPKGSHYQSKFSKNADKFGITWPKEDIYYWEHEHMTRTKAVKLYLKINPQFNVSGSWNAVQRLACNNNYSYIQRYFDDIRKNSTN